MLQGHDGTHWTLPTIEAMANFMAGRLGVPSADLMEHLFGKPCEHSALYHDYELATVVLPRPDIAARIGKKLQTYDSDAKEFLSFARYLPVSQMPDETAEVYNGGIVAPLGKIGKRLYPRMAAFSRGRREWFMNKPEMFETVNIRNYMFLSDFLMMRDRRGPFAALSDAEYHNCLTSLITDAVIERNVILGIIDDIDGNVPSHLVEFFRPYDGVMTIDNCFTMKLYRNRLTRSFCERTTKPSACNQHIDEVRAMLHNLSRFVRDSTTTTEIAEMLKRYDVN